MSNIVPRLLEKELNPPMILALTSPMTRPDLLMGALSTGIGSILNSSRLPSNILEAASFSGEQGDLGLDFIVRETPHRVLSFNITRDPTEFARTLNGLRGCANPIGLFMEEYAIANLNVNDGRASYLVSMLQYALGREISSLAHFARSVGRSVPEINVPTFQSVLIRNTHFRLDILQGAIRENHMGADSYMPTIEPIDADQYRRMERSNKRNGLPSERHDIISQIILSKIDLNKLISELNYSSSLFSGSV